MKNLTKFLKNKLGSNKDPKTTLKQEILLGNLEFVQDFTKNHYYDVHYKDQQMHSYLDYACLSGNVELIRFFNQAKVKLGSLLYKTHNQSKFLQHIINLKEAGYDLNSLDALGYAPVHYAALLKFEKVLKQLLEWDVKLLQSSIYGDNPVFSDHAWSKRGGVLPGIYTSRS